jgi:hypothetical protein
MLASVRLRADFPFVPRYNIAPTHEASIVALEKVAKQAVISGLLSVALPHAGR